MKLICHFCTCFVRRRLFFFSIYSIYWLIFQILKMNSVFKHHFFELISDIHLFFKIHLFFFWSWCFTFSIIKYLYISSLFRVLAACSISIKYLFDVFCRQNSLIIVVVFHKRCDGATSAFFLIFGKLRTLNLIWSQNIGENNIHFVSKA